MSNAYEQLLKQRLTTLQEHCTVKERRVVVVASFAS
jgi:hypothetical protein